jgi:hypothetical protein
MKKKKTDFEAKFWSGTRKHTAISLLETFFQFNDLAATKETLNEMVQSSVQKNTRIAKEPAEIFHLYQSLRSFILVAHQIAKKAKKGSLKFQRKSVFQNDNEPFREKNTGIRCAYFRTLLKSALYRILMIFCRQQLISR